jgi:hypothetical protein
VEYHCSTSHLLLLLLLPMQYQSLLLWRMLLAIRCARACQLD